MEGSKRTVPSMLGDLGRILRRAGLEELGDARQTGGDVLGLGGLAGDLGEDGATGDGVAVVDLDAGARGDGERAELACRRRRRSGPAGSARRSTR
jgi:hypothetical protein